jgi:hypothetical protein
MAVSLEDIGRWTYRACGHGWTQGADMVTDVGVPASGALRSGDLTPAGVGA